ncbi:MAG: hypothetical protein WA539_11125 [Candidatus Sulfotelmatobacter sp.]
MLDWPEIIKGGISAGWGLIGVVAGSCLTGRHQRIERRNARFKEQLLEFYAPLRAMRADIKAKSDLRVKVAAIAAGEWQQKFAGISRPEAKKQIDERAWAGYEKLQQYSDDQLKSEIIPTYRKMLEHFMSNMGYAEASTIAHYPAFVEFVEIWNRFLGNSLPREVAEKLSQAEKTLYPLYDDIEKHARRLCAKLNGEPWLWQKAVAWWSS